MRPTFLFAALLLLPCAAFAQQTPPADPTQDTKSETIQADPLTNDNSPLVIETQDPSGFTLGSFGAVMPDKRVTLDLDNASLRDAVRSICDQAKQKYEIDKDVPDDARITIHAKNVRFATALDLVTQAAGVGWSHEANWQSGDNKKAGSLNSRFRITKNPHANGAYPFVFSGDTKGNPRFGNSFSLGNGGTFFSADPKANPGFSTSLSYGKGNGQSFYQLLEPERRSTFTCPHCKGQVTVVRHPQATKCPKCGRTFQGDWKFCPVDGTPRPKDPGDWKFCPLCGKPIDLDKDQSSLEIPMLSKLPLIGRLFQREPLITP